MDVLAPRRVDEAFKIFRRRISASPADRRLARQRVKVVRRALRRDRCVRAVYLSGSFARRTQCRPIHDVDLIVVFDRRARPEWDRDRESAAAALTEVEQILKRHLGYGDGSGTGRIQRIEPKNRVVECYLDVGVENGNPRSFAVDIMPTVWERELARGIRLTNVVRAPGRLQHEWISTNPLYLRRRFAVRNWWWWRFPALARMLREWRRFNYPDLKSLTVDVLALHHLPRRLWHPLLTQQEAIAIFFDHAANAVLKGVDDPAGKCGEIQPRLKRQELSESLARAAELSRKALDCERDELYEEAICKWGQIFGPKFPAPRGGCAGFGDEDGSTGLGDDTGRTPNGRPGPTVVIPSPGPQPPDEQAPTDPVPTPPEDEIPAPPPAEPRPPGTPGNGPASNSEAAKPAAATSGWATLQDAVRRARGADDPPAAPVTFGAL
ncbi:hypothetical protein I6A60_05970 [Frankia sp. AgB1.9]|uniref:nucleotidyltransferase domain-containing protein n=1 Tax=unclassified Frankia TaxID=2632575 RepID=UPI001934B10F|nr:MULTISPECIES: nucleotidyltransferase [unclassified Frankia]MBL7487465.1 hypothetical protein [Frankia sp. AgW1.1]MBL7547427.1 hypothetical protein [Frankia sp. AgB1.9]MBL7618798.1 hypothetical protein [Frankia sp. AgB1.8]